MSFAAAAGSVAVEPLDHETILRQVERCPQLPSLRRIGASLREMLDADQRYLAQVSDLIRRDPSLTSHVFQLANSAYFSLRRKVGTVEEAVFHLGIRRVRQLAMTTPVVDDFQKMTGPCRFHWRGFWQHCLGTAMITRELTRFTRDEVSEVVYVAGLLHDVGKIVMATQFPDHFNAITERIQSEGGDPREHELQLLGMDHSELGAQYLSAHSLPEPLVESARHHHAPELYSGPHQLVVAAVGSANLISHFGKLGDSGNPIAVSRETWQHSLGWQLVEQHSPMRDMPALERDLIRMVDRLRPVLEFVV
jgi:putative nucleotidyltransferase with HDIG domain